MSQTIRSREKDQQWREGLAQNFAAALGRSHDPQEADRIWQAYEASMADGPDFARCRGGSDFREPPLIAADSKTLWKWRGQLVAIARGSWEHKAKGSQAGLISHTTIAVYDALCGLARKYGRVFPSLRNLGRLARCSRTTAIAALKTLVFFGFVTSYRRLKRIQTPLGKRVVQDTNAYDLHAPKGWGKIAVEIFAPPSESSPQPAREIKFLFERTPSWRRPSWPLANRSAPFKSAVLTPLSAALRLSPPAPS